MEEDVKELVFEIAAHILKLAGIGDNLEENRKKILESIENKAAYRKFIELVKTQGGDISYLNNIKEAKYILPVKSNRAGYIYKLNAKYIRRSICRNRSWKSKKRRQNRPFSTELF